MTDPAQTLGAFISEDELAVDNLVIHGAIRREGCIVEAAEALLRNHRMTPDTVGDLTPEEVLRRTGLAFEDQNEIRFFLHYISVHYKTVCRDPLNDVIEQEASS